MKSRIGKTSLLIAIAGLIFMEMGLYFEIFQAQAWRILATGFEAATIGGLADWFAVSALFQEIPLPLVRRHTNIIVKNRKKLTEAIVELVTQKWLSPEIIREKLSDVNMVDGFLQVLEEDKNREKAMDFLRNILLRFADNLDNPEMVHFLQKMMQDQISGLDLASPLGRWMEDVLHEKEHHKILEMVLEELGKAIEEPEPRKVIQSKLKLALEAYEKQDWIKKSTVWIGKKTGGIDLEMLTDRLLDIARMLAKEAKTNPLHPLRIKLDESLMEFARNLKEGKSASRTFVEELQVKLVNNQEIHQIVKDILGKFKNTVLDQLAGNQTSFMRMVSGNIWKLLEELKEDKIQQQRINNWLKDNISQLVEKYHHEIGNMVRTSLSKLDDKGLVTQIRDKVGDDLQYIRLNGAIVGGLAGMLIGLIKLLLL